jgi:hypothetical protein
MTFFCGSPPWIAAAWSVHVRNDEAWLSRHLNTPLAAKTEQVFCLLDDFHPGFLPRKKRPDPPIIDRAAAALAVPTIRQL